MARTLTDNMTIVAKKNRVNHAQLQTELSRIKREQLMEMRLHNNKKQRFKHKFAKLDVFDEKRGTDPSDVIMYETHNPGFCYHRNGECRLPQSNIKNLSVEFEDVHRLVFTEDEVDIEKVLFLYMLAVHRTDSLAPPPKSQKTSFLTREQSPLERILDRSKKLNFNDHFNYYVTKNLPLFIIETRSDEDQKKPDVAMDPRLQGKLIINEKIVQLVHSVMIALKNANEDLYEQMIQVSRDAEFQDDLVRMGRLARFTRSIEGMSLFTSCESFYLINPPETCEIQTLFVETYSGTVERFVDKLRKNIFKLPVAPSSTTVPMPQSFSVNELIPKSTSTLLSRHNMSEDIVLGRIPRRDIGSGSVRTMTGRSSTILPRKSDKFDFKMDATSYAETNFTSDDEERYSVESETEEPTKNIRIDDFMKTSALLNKKMNKTIRKEEADLAKELAELDRLALQKLENLSDLTSCDDQVSPCTSSFAGSSGSCKYSIRRSTCEACRQMWKKQLPAPKISKLVRNVLPTINDDTLSLISSPSVVMLSNLIDQELKKWVSEDVRSVKPGPITHTMYRNMARGSYAKNGLIEVVNLDQLHLAKIRQEIRERETQKRLVKFLRS